MICVRVLCWFVDYVVVCYCGLNCLLSGLAALGVLRLRWYVLLFGCMIELGFVLCLMFGCFGCLLWLFMLVFGCWLVC